MNALMRILAYLYGTQDLGIVLLPGDSDTLILEAWCDASFDTHTDNKSHTGYGFTFRDSRSGLFYSRSQKQPNTALSSTESELYAAVEVVKDGLWFRGLLAEIGFPQLEPTPIKEDNAGLITLASQYSGNHKRVKHFLRPLNFLIDHVNLKNIVFEKVPTVTNKVDGLTKPLGPTEFLPKRDLHLGVPTHL
jgi:hypothetical protein